MISSTTGNLINRRSSHIGSACSVFFKHNPLNIVKAKDQYLFDSDNNTYLDCISNVQHVGHCNEYVCNAISEQLKLSTCNSRFLNENLIKCCEKLKSTLPPALDTIFFCNSGSEANDLALRLASDYAEGAKDVIVVDHAYHGHLSSMIDISPYKFNGKGGRGKPDHVHVAPCPDVYRGKHRLPDNQLHDEVALKKLAEIYALEVKSIFENCVARGRKVAVFIMESLQSCGGQVIPPPGYIEAVLRIVHENGALFVADEVQTGFGRIGTNFWAFQLYDKEFTPDIVTMGKPMGNGFPVSAVATKRHISDRFGHGMEYFNTFGGNPVSCVAALSVMEVIERENLLQNAILVGDYFLEKLNWLKLRYSIIGDVRGVGLFLGVEFVKDLEQRTPATEDALNIISIMRSKNIILSAEGPDSNIIKIKPPMCFSIENVDHVIKNLDEVLKIVIAKEQTTRTECFVAHAKSDLFDLRFGSIDMKFRAKGRRHEEHSQNDVGAYAEMGMDGSKKYGKRQRPMENRYYDSQSSFSKMDEDFSESNPIDQDLIDYLISLSKGIQTADEIPIPTLVERCKEEIESSHADAILLLFSPSVSRALSTIGGVSAVFSSYFLKKLLSCKRKNIYQVFKYSGACGCLESMLYKLGESYNSSVENPDDAITDNEIAAIIKEIGDLIVEDVENLVGTFHGSHLLRCLARTFCGLGKRDGRKNAENTIEMDSTINGELSTIFKQGFEILLNFVLNWSFVQEQLNHEPTSLLIQECLDLCTKYSSSKHLQHFLDDCISSDRKLISRQICDKFASRFYEKMIKCSDESTFERFFNSHCKGNLVHFGNNFSGNFVVQRIIEKCNSEKMFSEILDELRPIVNNIWSQNKHGLLSSFLVTSATIGCHQEELKNMIYGFLEIDAQERGVAKILSILLLKKMSQIEETVDINFADVKYFGGMFLQNLFKFTDNEDLVDSFLALKIKTLVLLVCHESACFAVRSFLSSSSVTDEKKTKFFEKIKPSLPALAEHKVGFHTLNFLHSSSSARNVKEIDLILMKNSSRLAGSFYGKRTLEKFNLLNTKNTSHQYQHKGRKFKKQKRLIVANMSDIEDKELDSGMEDEENQSDQESELENEQKTADENDNRPRLKIVTKKMTKTRKKVLNRKASESRKIEKSPDALLGTEVIDHLVRAANAITNQQKDADDLLKKCKEEVFDKNVDAVSILKTFTSCKALEIIAGHSFDLSFSFMKSFSSQKSKALIDALFSDDEHIASCIEAVLHNIGDKFYAENKEERDGQIDEEIASLIEHLTKHSVKIIDDLIQHANGSRFLCCLGRILCGLGKKKTIFVSVFVDRAAIKSKNAIEFKSTFKKRFTSIVKHLLDYEKVHGLFSNASAVWAVDSFLELDAAYARTGHFEQFSESVVAADTKTVMSNFQAADCPSPRMYETIIVYCDDSTFEKFYNAHCSANLLEMLSNECSNCIVKRLLENCRSQTICADMFTKLLPIWDQLWTEKKFSIPACMTRASAQSNYMQKELLEKLYKSLKVSEENRNLSILAIVFLMDEPELIKFLDDKKKLDTRHIRKTGAVLLINLLKFDDIDDLLDRFLSLNDEHLAALALQQSASRVFDVLFLSTKVKDDIKLKLFDKIKPSIPNMVCHMVGRHALESIFHAKIADAESIKSQIRSILIENHAKCNPNRFFRLVWWNLGMYEYVKENRIMLNKDNAAKKRPNKSQQNGKKDHKVKRHKKSNDS
uniref:Uncharacterized protein n=1 Tax=Romanomermis culicivorax TaxID=13658 RepID=A0A915KEL4_ROMCU